MFEFVSIAVPGQQKLDEHDEEAVFPPVLVPEPGHVTLCDAVHAIERVGASLLDELGRHGALILRGLPVRDAADFLAILNAFHFEYDDYIGGERVARAVVFPTSRR